MRGGDERFAVIDFNLLFFLVWTRFENQDNQSIDEEVCDVDERDAERCGVPDRRLVIAVFPERSDEVLPLLDRDADITPLSLGCRRLRVLPGPFSRAGRLLRHHKDIDQCCRVSLCPRSRLGASSTKRRSAS